MLHITSLDEGLEIFKALGSDIRIQILNILLKENNMSMNQLASRLNITGGALTGHIKKLEECGIITTTAESQGHGNQKLCSLHIDKILIDVEQPIDYSNVYNASLKVGQYSNHSISPTCGLANTETVIGELDDARYFDHPDRYSAEILWLTKGYVEYAVPNFIPPNQDITQISVSFEISSYSPGCDSNWPSDISFYINNTLIGKWTSPGDFGDIRGIFTPDWWPINMNQYGMLKLLVINKHGTYMDGLKISDVSTPQLQLDSTSTIKFKLGVDDDSEHVGGMTLFGKNFGNYGQDINVSINYMPKD